MSRHSKNNTASATFTYAERKALRDYGTQELRLGKESILSFHHCFLCLTEGIERDNMVVCVKGHVACKECQLKNILSQKRSHQQKLEAFEKERKLQKIKEKKLQIELENEQELKFKRKYEIMKIGENKKDMKTVSDSIKSKNEKDFPSPSPLPISIPPLRIKCQGKVNNHNHNLDNDNDNNVNNNETFDHSLSIDQLFPVHLQLNCPTCIKSFLNNAIRVFVIKSCGHLICKDCMERTKECSLCNNPIPVNDIEITSSDAPVTDNVTVTDIDIKGNISNFHPSNVSSFLFSSSTIEIFKVGTGFSGGGNRDKIIVRKGGIAFSC